ncbi:CDP-diacylglycerol--serine O-phosphatidyltransferase [Puteibacter caeruleilacunae]|nr:CDP-diacylglycerol--serine O-phosphatidyltransferase [Puteibacter caeruleilacunae]
MTENPIKLWTIPNFVTLLNLLSGVVGILFALQGELKIAGILVIIASVFDFLDGFAARMLKSYSSIGAQLDSLADMISFGLLPGILAFSLISYAQYGGVVAINNTTLTSADYLYFAATALIPMFSALRLAKFNIDTRQSDSFIGLPTPACAILFASFAILAETTTYPEVIAVILNPKIIIGFVVIFSILLVSEIPMFSFKFKHFGFSGDNKLRYFFLLLSVILFGTLLLYAIPIIIILYILISFIIYLAKS